MVNIIEKVQKPTLVLAYNKTLAAQLCSEFRDFFPASHFATSSEKLQASIKQIEIELEKRLKELNSQDKLLEAQRLKQRTNYDIEMMREVGYCTGIENYSRIIDVRNKLTPHTPKQFCTIQML